MGTTERVPTAAEVTAVLAQWSEWMTAHTDTLLDLDDRVRVAGTAVDQADVAAAFVARKALTTRLDEVRALAATDRLAAVRRMEAPVVDDLGGPVGSNVDDAARLFDAVLTRVASNVAAAETAHADMIRVRAQFADQLAVAQQLSTSLGSQVNRVTQIANRAATASHDDEWVSVTGALRSVVDDLRREDQQRTALVDRLAVAPARLEALRAEETQVRELSVRCRAKVLQAPNLAVPSVAALGELPTVDAAAGEPWAATRARIEPWLDRVDRIGAALAHARTRFQQPLDQRDQQRGLLQAFRDKAAAAGYGEHPDVETLYRSAEQVLWSAPCDLAAAEPLVQQFLGVVNAKVAAR
jgi:hypothetical protein